MKIQTKEKSRENKNIALDADKWDVYIIIDFTVAFILVIVSVASADIPRKRIEIVRKPAPYVATGWAPSGQQLNLPLKAPVPSYGPPPPPPEVETTITEQPTTTETPTTTEENLAQVKSENIELEPESEQVDNVAQTPAQTPQGGRFYVVLPQAQSVVYGVPRTAALLAIPKNEFVARAPRLQNAPVSTGVFTPFSASYIQIYQ